MLVVGFGNSGGEIALDLANAGVDVALAVRGPVQILPRDLLGFPILSWAILYRRLPARLVDIINAPILRLAVGSIEKLGLRRAAKGPRQMVEEDGRVPLIDIGTLAQDQGRLDQDTRRHRSPDAGWRDVRRCSKRKIRRDHSCDRFPSRSAPVDSRCEGVFDGHGMPRVTGRATDAPGLYFCGQITSPTGQLREIGIEAQRIADSAKRYAASCRALPRP